MKKDQKKEKKLSPDKAAILLEGPPGIGKTSIVYALANDLNMQVVETNASDTRTKDALEKRLKETSKSRDIMDFITKTKEKLILIDEVDGIYGVKDKGAVPTIQDLVEATQFPIIMCANEYKQSLQPLYKNIKRFEVQSLSKSEIKKITGNILKNEGITTLNEETLNTIILKNGGDLRGIINDLQGISQGVVADDKDELILSLYRDNTEMIFSLIRDLFQKVTTLKQAKILTSKSDEDYNRLYRWVNENLPTFIKKNSDLAEAYENLSLADEIFGRIQKNQYWGLLPYFYDLFAGGVTLSQKEGSPSKTFRNVRAPKFFSSRAFSSAEVSLVEKINNVYEISQNEVIQDLIPFLKILCGPSRKILKNISDWLELDAKEKKLLKV